VARLGVGQAYGAAILALAPITGASRDFARTFGAELSAKMALPELVTRSMRVARTGAIAITCEPDLGALLAVLAASLPNGGRVLELGTGAGTSLAWLLHGVGARTDIELFTIDPDQLIADFVSQDP
jgi:demethylmenaquinone methyltransferase/2-methoxy-6-polyprenyl-1,4-benzoquinol methylase